MQVDHGLFDCHVQVVLPWQPLSYYWWCADQSDSLLEAAVKWVLNAVSTGAHVLRGKVLNNKMVDLRVRCVGWPVDRVITKYKKFCQFLTATESSFDVLLASYRYILPEAMHQHGHSHTHSHIHTPTHTFPHTLPHTHSHTHISHTHTLTLGFQWSDT